MTLAWHFVSDTLRDGRPVPADGEWLEHDGPLVMCASGLHASERLIDALQYAPGAIICRVGVDGDIIHDSDKLVATRRRILWRVDGDELLRAFARRVPLDVAGLWDMPEAVRQFLETGDAALAEAAYAATAAYAAGYAAGYAASAAASAAAGYAARAAAKSTAAYAASAAYAAGYAARAAAKSTAAYAASAAYAAGYAAYAARGAADAARGAAMDKYNAWLTEMVEAAHAAKVAR